MIIDNKYANKLALFDGVIRIEFLSLYQHIKRTFRVYR